MLFRLYKRMVFLTIEIIRKGIVVSSDVISKILIFSKIIYFQAYFFPQSAHSDHSPMRVPMGIVRKHFRYLFCPLAFLIVGNRRSWIRRLMLCPLFKFMRCEPIF